MICLPPILATHDPEVWEQKQNPFIDPGSRSTLHDLTVIAPFGAIPKPQPCSTIDSDGFGCLLHVPNDGAIAPDHCVADTMNVAEEPGEAHLAPAQEQLRQPGSSLPL